jgi:hypothetical protein
MGRSVDEAVNADVRLRLCGVATDSMRVVLAWDPALTAETLLPLPFEAVAPREELPAPRFDVEEPAVACPFLEGPAAACAPAFFWAAACFAVAAGATSGTIATEATSADTDKKKCLTSPL